MEELDLKEMFFAFWDKKIYIILITLLFIILGAVYTYVYVTPVYQSYTSLLLTQSGTTISQSDISLNQALVPTYSELIKSKTFLREVLTDLQTPNASSNMKKLSEEDLRKAIGVTYVASTAMIKITVTNEDAEVASDIANEISTVFIKNVSDTYKLNNIQVVDPAEKETVPYNIHHKTDIVMFAVIGVALSFVIIFIIYLLNTSIRTAEDVERAIKLPVIAEIPKII